MYRSIPTPAARPTIDPSNTAENTAVVARCAGESTLRGRVSPEECTLNLRALEPETGFGSIRHEGVFRDIANDGTTEIQDGLE